MALTDFHCMFCGRARSEVEKLIYGPAVFICTPCVSRCMDLLGGGALSTFAAGSQVAYQPSGPEVPRSVQEYRREHRPVMDDFPSRCSFCGKSTAAARVTVRGYMDTICDDCVGLSIEIAAEQLGGPWKERVESWKRLASSAF
jgi:ATP-dependent protease Clp ATPase subunit